MPRLFPVFCCLLISLATTGFSSLAPIDIPVSQLPAAVGAALKKKFPTASPESAQKSEERNDYVYYYVTLANGEKHTLVTITEVGEIVSSAPAKPTASPTPGS